MGIGTRDESTGEYFHSEGMENGHWYVGEDDSLYIVPDDRFGLEECAGPDNGTMAELNAAYREGKFDTVDQFALAKRLGLEVVSKVLFRFDPESGFYTA